MPHDPQYRTNPSLWNRRSPPDRTAPLLWSHTAQPFPSPLLCNRFDATGYASVPSPQQISQSPRYTAPRLPRRRRNRPHDAREGRRTRHRASPLNQPQRHLARAPQPPGTPTFTDRNRLRSHPCLRHSPTRHPPRRATAGWNRAAAYGGRGEVLRRPTAAHDDNLLLPWRMRCARMTARHHRPGAPRATPNRSNSTPAPGYAGRSRWPHGIGPRRAPGRCGLPSATSDGHAAEKPVSAVAENRGRERERLRAARRHRALRTSPGIPGVPNRRRRASSPPDPGAG